MDKNYGYKHTKGFIVFVFVVLMMGIVAAYAQTATLDITGNLVNNTQTATSVTSTWQNATFQNELTCWSPGGPGYCGPNPIVRPDGNINFSYGLVDLHQKVNVANALASTGLVTTGFKFEWTSKNGNGWDDGRQDALSAYVKLYNSGDSKVIESFNYNLSAIHNWTSYSWSENWANTKIGYRGSQVGNVQFGFVGRDNNYWAGPYGPEVNNVSFQLKYKPDPCKNNPLYSPECPNFQDQLAKMTATPKTESDLPPPPNGLDPLRTDDQKDPKESPDHMNDEKYEEGYVEVDMDRLIDTLFKIEDNREKENKITEQASQNAIRETNQISQQTVKQSERIAEKLTKDSIETSLAHQQVIITETKDNRSSQSLALFQAPTFSTSFGFQLPGIQQQSSSLHLQNQSNQSQITLSSQQEQSYKPPIQSNVFNLSTSTTQGESASQSATANSLGPTIQTQATFTQTTNVSLLLSNSLLNQTTETPILSNNFLTNKADPINSIIEDKPQKEAETQQTQSKQVKSNVQDNDVAVNGVSINNIAVVPTGFNAYMIALTDVSFYAPKEIYKNQKVVDNVRVLRQLASDRLHQQMVDQQYSKR